MVENKVLSSIEMFSDGAFAIVGFLIIVMICGLFSCTNQSKTDVHFKRIRQTTTKQLPDKDISKTEFMLKKVYENKIELLVPDYLPISNTVNTGEGAVQGICNTFSSADKGDNLSLAVTVFRNDAEAMSIGQLLNLEENSPNMIMLTADTMTINGNYLGYVEYITPIGNKDTTKLFSYELDAFTFINNNRIDLTGEYIGRDYKKYTPDFYKSLYSLKISGF